MVAKKIDDNTGIKLPGLRTYSKSQATRFTIPTGCLAIDYGLMGKGGFTTGIVVELYGWEGCGKTTLAMNIAKQTQKMGGLVLLSDIEPWEEERMQQLSVSTDSDKLLYIEGQTLEKIFQNIFAAAEAFKAMNQDKPIVIILDSIALGVTEDQLDAIRQGKGDGGLGIFARIVGTRLKVMQLLIKDSTILFVVINQFRKKINTGPVWLGGGTSDDTTSGSALKYATIVRLNLKTGKTFTAKQLGDDSPVGQVIKPMLDKNKLTPPNRVKEYLQYYNGKFGNWYTIVTEAEKAGLIKRSGSWYNYEDKARWQGQEGIISVEKEILAELVDKLIIYWRQQINDIYSVEGGDS